MDLKGISLKELILKHFRECLKVAFLEVKNKKVSFIIKRLDDTEIINHTILCNDFNDISLNYKSIVEVNYHHIFTKFEYTDHIPKNGEYIRFIFDKWSITVRTV